MSYGLTGRNGLRKGDEHSAYDSVEYGTLKLYLRMMGQAKEFDLFCRFYTVHDHDGLTET